MAKKKMMILIDYDFYKNALRENSNIPVNYDIVTNYYRNYSIDTNVNTFSIWAKNGRKWNNCSIHYLSTILTNVIIYHIFLMSKDSHTLPDNLDRLLIIDSIRKCIKKSNNKWYRLLRTKKVRKIYYKQP